MTESLTSGRVLARAREQEHTRASARECERGDRVRRTDRRKRKESFLPIPSFLPFMRLCLGTR